VPTARLADGKKAYAAVAEQSLERAPRVQHGYGHIMSVARETGRQDGGLPLASADG
jgi:hypothetical protein